jgi:hypothetical protein
VLTVRNNTASTPRNTHQTVHKHYSFSSHSLVDKVTNARKMDEQVLHMRIIERDGKVMRASGWMILEYGYDVGDLVSGKEFGVGCFH